MDNETVTDYKPKYYVKFDVNSGKILQMSIAPIEQVPLDHILVLETENQIVEQVLNGNLSKRKIGPVFDIENNKWEIGEKSRHLHLRELSTRLIQVTDHKNPDSSDINVTVYRQDGTMDIKANLGTIKKNMNLADISEISKSAETGLLNLYFTRKGDPDYLISSVQVDPVILLRSKKLQYKLPDDMAKHTEVENISIFTRPVFHSYNLNILDKFIQSDKNLGKMRVLQVAEEHDDSHLTMVRNGNTIKVQSFIDVATNHISSNNVKFLICDKHVDNPVGGFAIPADQLNDHAQLEIPLDFKWPADPLVIYKAPGFVISYLGDTYDTAN